MGKELKTDPWTIYHWDLGRFAFNFTCWQRYLEEKKLQGSEWSDEPPEWEG